MPLRATPASLLITKACVIPNDEPYSCQTADEYLFWDGIHPTNAAHAIVSDEAARVLAQQ